jgi:hypothetical protein
MLNADRFNLRSTRVMPSLAGLYRRNFLGSNGARVDMEPINQVILVQGRVYQSAKMRH